MVQNSSSSLQGSSSKKRALFVGRFQPFHKGHLHAIKWILSENPDISEVIIAVGSSQYSHTESNPFTCGERMEMILAALEEAGIPRDRYILTHVPDLHVHSLWVAHVVSLLPRFDVVFTNDPLTARLFKEAGFEVRSVPWLNRELYSATEVRERMIEGSNWEELVPPSVARYIKRIGGDVRARELFARR